MFIDEIQICNTHTNCKIGNVYDKNSFIKKRFENLTSIKNLLTTIPWITTFHGLRTINIWRRVPEESSVCKYTIKILRIKKYIIDLIKSFISLMVLLKLLEILNALVMFFLQRIGLVYWWSKTLYLIKLGLHCISSMKGTRWESTSI